MVTLTPYSNGEDNAPFIEFNPCHDPKSGKFSSHTQGRCSDASRSLLNKFAVDALLGNRATLDHVANVRRTARRGEKDLPGYLQKELPKFRKERAVLLQTPESGVSPLTPQRKVSSGTSAASVRMAILNLHSMQGARKAHILTVARHELGHISPQAFAKTARIVGFDSEAETDRLALRIQKDYDGFLSGDAAYSQAVGHVKTYVEELRAWRNAVRDSGGRVAWNSARSALASYLEYELQKTPLQAAKEANLHVYGLKRYAKRLRRLKRVA